MQLSELIKTFKEETDEWPETPNELLDFCEYKYNIGEIDMVDYYKLASKLHNKGRSAHPIH
ncbi:YppF family protein [Salirhabdus sp. Marseille-P4669]|uniref:YppF family protein n=1 Tax=Salirhabdus sp. Marseille-P4669 TaxID=2042310 RepID=UPI0013578EA7|nr:YppF family protein [Salirhabdus sp. Marseille-P4669]